MGSGKSTILKNATPLKTTKHVTYCQDFDILGSIVGADALAKFKKTDVFKYLANYNGKKIVIAGEYYSKQVDVERFIKLGFKPYCVLLNVDRAVIYKRILNRGGGQWNEKTYANNMSSRINFYKKFKGFKVILKNNVQEDVIYNYNFIKTL